MDRIFLRNYALFCLILVLSTGSLIYILIAGEKDIDQSSNMVSHTHEVISKAEQLSAFTESMLAAQRGFIITGDLEFSDRWHQKENIIEAYLIDLKELTQNNNSQQVRLKKLHGLFHKFAAVLEERARRFTGQNPPRRTLESTEVIDSLKNEISHINQEILNEEYYLLQNRIDAIEDKKGRYFATLFICITLTSALLLLLNGFLLRAQTGRSKAESMMKDTQERFRLAIEGTNDGIFDWDIKENKLFWSPQFKRMLGYEDREINASIEEFERLVHDHDMDNFNKTIELYMKGEIPEFSAIFRMHHKSGKWLWINARGKAAFDKQGRATRMVGAYTDITALKDYEQRLEDARMQAEQANQAKSDFLAHMSHEIRTPLTAISGIAEILEKNKDSLNEKQKKLVRTLTSSTSALKDLINDILDFSKIETGQLDLVMEDCDMSSFLEEIASIMRVRANQKSIRFELDYEGVKSRKFYGDSMRLRQILINLVGNAVKFTESGSVKVHAYSQDKNGQEILVIDVIDTGIGIQPEKQDIVFERFKQADPSISRKYGGTGLGLPISRNLAQLMGGNITLHSKPGQGSTFTLALPFTQIPGAGEKEKNPEIMPSRTRARRAKITKNKKILLTEDYEGNIVVLSYLLEEMNCDYNVARTGREALQLWQDNQYDLILMDIQMPEMDGLTATSTIRLLENERNLPRTPIIGMTAHAMADDKYKCLQAGMDAYLPKPIVESELTEQILKHLKKVGKAA